jgi:hydroxymethylpyrimidine pyrophosphatase-like HAD family hydrolase
MAIGNSQNDIAMLERAGFSVAVANAENEIRQAADFVTTSNNDDGVAAAIEKFIL